MIGLALVVLSATIVPLRGAADLAYRYEVAQAIESVDATPREHRQLMKLAAFESHYRRDVGECTTKGDNGKAVTLWQMHVFGRDRMRVCRSLREGAREALWMVRQSIHECHDLSERERLSLYTSGDCRKGHQASRLRWAE